MNADAQLSGPHQRGADTIDHTTYFPSARTDCPTFVDDSEWAPLVDGESYFGELLPLLTGLGTGDSVQISGFELDAGLDLAGRVEGTDGYLPLGELLARAASDGAQVRVLLAGKIPARSIRLASLAGFRDNVRNADLLRRWRPTSHPHGVAPLADSVLVDWGGKLLGSNHQKVVVVDRGGVLTAFVCGIDLTAYRFDASPHDRLELDGERWGWHDAAARLRGPAAARVHAILVQRWDEAATLPPRMFPRHDPLRLPLLNPLLPAPALAAAAPQDPVPTPGTSVRVLRSVPDRKVDSTIPMRRQPWRTLPDGGVQEIHETLVHAIGKARRYVYLEDQYLEEYLGGQDEYELYPHLHKAASRGVKIILVGSGRRDPGDPGLYLRPINSRLNRDLDKKLVGRLNKRSEANVVVHRIEHLTVHAKIVLIDDVFATIGSANMFSRSMIGTDSEVSTSVVTSTPLVRDLRTKVWGEHLRTPLTPDVRGCLEDLDVALGIWHPDWLPTGLPATTWRRAGEPTGFAPTESVLRTVWPADVRGR